MIACNLCFRIRFLKVFKVEYLLKVRYHAVSEVIASLLVRQILANKMP